MRNNNTNNNNNNVGVNGVGRVKGVKRRQSQSSNTTPYISTASESTKTHERFFEKQLLLPALPKSNPASIYGGEIPVIYTNRPNTVEDWIQEHIYSQLDQHDPPQPVVVGFDSESPPDLPWESYHLAGHLTCVQLAVSDATLVVQLVDGEGLNVCNECVPPLKKLLNDPNIFQVGVGLDMDMVEIYREWNNDNSTDSQEQPSQEIRNRFDLGNVRIIDKPDPQQQETNANPSRGGTISLRALADTVVGIDLKKPKRLSRSDWGLVPLSEKQIVYAARDAWVSMAAFSELYQRDETLLLRTMRRLQEEEMPIHDLDQLVRKRKQARQELKAVGIPYEGMSLEDIPDEVQTEISRLKEKILQTAPPKPLAMDFFQTEE